MRLKHLADFTGLVLFTAICLFGFDIGVRVLHLVRGGF